MKKATLFIGIGVIVLGLIGIVVIASSKKNANQPIGTPGVSQTTPSSNQPSKDTQITLDEINGHDNPQSCWMAIEGKVYDVTTFIPSHPGGSEILRGCGKDATTLFNTHGTIGGRAHSALARQLLAQYQIGVLQ